MNGFKKFLVGITVLLVTGLALYFGISVFMNTYFNRSFFYAPNIVGLNIETAKEMAKNSPIKILEVESEFSELPAGTIYLQEPSAKKIIKRNRTIRVWVSKGSNDTEIPDIIGVNYLDAQSLIETKGFTVGEIIEVTSDLPAGSVVATDPAIESAVLRNKKINMLVSSSSTAQIVSMPDIIGLTLDEAKALLQESSIVVGNIKREVFEGLDKDIVVESTIDFKDEVPAGTVVDLVVSN